MVQQDGTEEWGSPGPSAVGSLTTEFASETGAPVAGSGACLSPSQCLALLHGGLPQTEAAPMRSHFESCAACRMLVAEAARGSSPTNQGAAARAPLRTFAGGERVAGRYQIRRFIARGGMGEVYEAYDFMLGERVALKTLLLSASDREEAARWLMGEVRVARKVTHLNVVRIFDVGIHRPSDDADDIVPFLTMEFLVGETLAQRLARSGPCDAVTVGRIVADVAAGLEAVHGAGIVHRDLKSGNIFLVAGPDGEPSAHRAVIMDLGLACAFEDAPGQRPGKRGRMVGTPAYMAPEQLGGQTVAPAADLFSFGVVIYEMLTGRLPFGGRTSSSMLRSRLGLRARRPSSLVPTIAPTWDRVIDRCLDHDPVRRPSSAGEIPIMASRELPGVRAGRRLVPWLITAAAFGVVGAAGLATLARPRRVDFPPGRPEPTGHSEMVADHAPTPQAASVPVSAAGASDSAPLSSSISTGYPLARVVSRAFKGRRSVGVARASGSERRVPGGPAPGVGAVVGVPARPGGGAVVSRPTGTGEDPRDPLAEPPAPTSRPHHPDDLLAPF